MPTDVELLDLARVRLTELHKSVMSLPGSTKQDLSAFIGHCAAFELAGGFMGVAKISDAKAAHVWLDKVLSEVQDQVKKYTDITIKFSVLRKE